MLHLPEILQHDEGTIMDRYVKAIREREPFDSDTMYSAYKADQPVHARWVADYYCVYTSEDCLFILYAKKLDMYFLRRHLFCKKMSQDDYIRTKLISGNKAMEGGIFSGIDELLEAENILNVQAADQFILEALLNGGMQ